MIENIFYLLLALFGFGFLIFIHEWGHYWMARRVGMKVEVFSIGFGPAFFKWNRKGVEWRLSWIPFGGYVRVAGMESKKNLEPHKIEGGYFAAKPWDRIKFAAMGPIVNIVFAFLAFALIWMTGGRQKPFSEYTHTIGWVSPSTELFQEGIRPGDQVLTVNEKPFKGFGDFLYTALLDPSALKMTGREINYTTGAAKPFTYAFTKDSDLSGMAKASLALTSLRPAQYLLIDSFPKSSPMVNSGAKPGDRMIWADGDLLFSQTGLIAAINRQHVLLTVQRGSSTFLTRVPRLQIHDLRLTTNEREEFNDWRFEAKLHPSVNDLFFIPYNLTNSATVESPLRYIDEDAQAKLAFEEGERAPIETPLLAGDQILAVAGVPINSSYELLFEIQKKNVLTIVKRAAAGPKLTASDPDKGFVASFDMRDLQQILASIGTSTPLTSSGDLHLLNPITPTPRSDYPVGQAQAIKEKAKSAKRQQAVDEIEDEEEKEATQARLHAFEHQLKAGVYLRDRTVTYNPNPIILFGEVLRDTYRSLYALITGYLSPKALMGPVGMMTVVQQSMASGTKEGLFWLGMVSLNLGILNLLPIPILDGGHICFASYEIITRRRLNPKVMEKMMIPFLLLLLALFAYITFNDVSNLFTRFFK